MSLKNKLCIGPAVLALSMFFFNACGSESSSEPENVDAISSSSSLDAILDSTYSSSSVDMPDSVSSSSFPVENEVASSSSTKRESRLPKVDDQEGPFTRSYAIKEITERDGFTIIELVYEGCEVTTTNNMYVVRTFQWNSSKSGISALVVKKENNRLFLTKHASSEMKYIYDAIDRDNASDSLKTNYVGTSEDIYGEWNPDYPSLSTQSSWNSYVITKDSVFIRTHLNPDYKTSTPHELYEIFGKVFGSVIYSEISSDFSASFNELVDIPTRGIKLTETDSSILIDMNGQMLEYIHQVEYTTKNMKNRYTMKSDTTVCSYTLYEQSITKETCSSTYKDFIFESASFSTVSAYYLQDRLGKTEYEECYEKLFENNPANVKQ